MSTVDLGEYTAGVHQLIPILEKMELEITEVGNGRASARIPLEPNRNHFGVIYAGCLFTVAEMLGGVIGFNDLAMDGYVPLVKRLDITFSRPATTTVTASTSLSAEEIERVRAEAEADGKSDFKLVCDVVDENGVVVASTHGDYQLRRMS
ncbi:MAG TPA: PaaI family thioesterase [Aeromicrobium sp.]|nr:PaaI family thioesterase [Aeromicrobium sp.]